VVLAGESGAPGNEVMDSLDCRPFFIEGTDMKYLGTRPFG
jgi:hypothetical protein